MFRFDIRARDKVQAENFEYKLHRESFAEENFVLSRRKFCRYTRLFRGNTAFNKVLENAVKAYIADLRPELVSLDTYFEWKVLFEMEYPEDTGIKILPIRGFIEVQDKRSVDFAYAVGGDNRKEPVMPGSRLYFDSIIRRGAAELNPLDIVKQEVKRSLMRIAISSTEKMKNDNWSELAGFNNAGLLRALEVAIIAGAQQELKSVFQRAVVDNEKLNDFITLADRYRKEYTDVWTNRNYLKHPMLCDLAGQYQNWGLEDIAQAFTRYLISNLPARKWADTYSLDHVYSAIPRINIMDFREATLANNKYTLIFRPNWKMTTSPIPNIIRHNMKSAIYQTSDILVNEFYEPGMDFIINVGQAGRYRCINPIDINSAKPVESAESDVATFEPMPLGKALLGNKLMRDDIELIPEFAIINDSHQIFRLLQSMDSVKPTIIKMASATGVPMKVLYLPDTSGKLTMNYKYNKLQMLTPKVEHATVDGVTTEQMWEQLSPFMKKCFMKTKIMTYGEEESTALSMLGDTSAPTV